MVVLALFLSLLCVSNAFNLTYPIKGTQLGWQAGDPATALVAAADAGYNLLTFTFFGDAAYDAVANWDVINPAQKQGYIDYAHKKGMAVIMSAWIQKRYGNLINQLNATALGMTLANQVTSRHLDGIDIRIQELSPDYRIGALDKNASIDWVVNMTAALRKSLGPDAIIIFSAAPADFGPIGGSRTPGPFGGLVSIHPRISHVIQLYTIFYMDSGPACYDDYDKLFVTNVCSPSTSVSEISNLLNIDISRLIIAKPMDAAPAIAASGYIAPAAMRAIFSYAQANLKWNGGLVGWTWNNSGNASAQWINDIYPIPVVAATSGVPSFTSTTTSSTSSTSSSSSTSTSSSSTSSLSTLPPSPATSTSTTGSDGVKQGCIGGTIKDGICVCPDGSRNSGGKCIRRSPLVMIIAIVVPVVILVAILVAVFIFLWSRKRRQTVGPVRMMPAKSMSMSMSMSDLENNYQSSNLVTEFESIVIKSRLGQGGSGVVNLGIWRHIETAVKEFNNQDIATTDFIRESEIHAKLRHPNVVQLLAICLPPHMCTISEFMAKGSLADVLQDKPAAFTWKRKLQALHDIAKGMDYLHKSKIIHRDLKSQNCLIDKNWTCKIADFGTSKLVGEVNQTATAYVPRTAQWSAPEVITRGEYSEQSDVYSFGVIMWECVTGQVPYDGMFAFQVEDRTVKGSRLTIPVGCDGWLAGLMQECWLEDPLARPTFESIIAAVENSIPS